MKNLTETTATFKSAYDSKHPSERKFSHSIGTFYANTCQKMESRLLRVFSRGTLDLQSAQIQDEMGHTLGEYQQLILTVPDVPRDPFVKDIPEYEAMWNGLKTAIAQRSRRVGLMKSPKDIVDGNRDDDENIGAKNFVVFINGEAFAATRRGVVMRPIFDDTGQITRTMSSHIKILEEANHPLFVSDSSAA